MSTQITTAFVEQYKNNVQILSQQRGSVLRRAVQVDSGVVGKTKFAEQISSTAAVVRTTRHADSPLVHTPHARRAYSMYDYEWGDLIDSQDKVRLLIDPTSPYAVNSAMAMGRAMDDRIIAAATGTAYTGVDGTTAVTFASGSTNYIEDDATDIANSGGINYNLNVIKLRRAKFLLDNGDVDPTLRRYCVVSPSAMQSLLFTTKATSADYNAVRALVQGEVNTFLGFEFIMTTRLTTSAANVRVCFAFAEGGIELGIGEDIMARIEERADKSFSTYVYTRMTIGATRLEEAKVVAIECNEAVAFADN